MVLQHIIDSLEYIHSSKAKCTLATRIARKLGIRALWINEDHINYESFLPRKLHGKGKIGHTYADTR